MYPHHFQLLGSSVSVWNLSFLSGVGVGYVVLRYSFSMPNAPARPSLLWLRWLVTVYVAVIGAQLFAYAFDLKTSLIPPRSVSWANYYLNPLFGPKTLYGAIVFLPPAVLVALAPWRQLGFGKALERWTPALMAVLATARTGCFLQGCCYGVGSKWFGLSFSEGSVVYYAQFHEGLVAAGSASLPVIPTQALSVVVLAGLGWWSMRALAAGRRRIFVDVVALYSAYRFLLEFVRDDPGRNFYGMLSTSQWIAFGILAAYLARWGYLRTRRDLQ